MPGWLMDDSNLVLHPHRYNKILRALSALRQGCWARGAFLISRSGQEVAFDGEDEGLDRQAFSSLAAGTVAATFGLAELIGEEEFQRVVHRGRESSLLMCPVGNRALLILLLKAGDTDRVCPRSLARGILVLRDLLRNPSRQRVREEA